MNTIPTLTKEAVVAFVASHYATELRHELLTEAVSSRRFQRTEISVYGNNKAVVVNFTDALREAVVDQLRLEFDVSSKLIELDDDGTELEEGDEYTLWLFTSKNS